MSTSPVPRLLAICLLASLLGGLFVLGGAGWPAQPSPVPSEEALADDYAAHVGEEVQLGGTVLREDPTAIEVDSDEGSFELAVENAPAAEPGEEVILAGELRPDRTIAADPGRSIVRDPWERTYMYAISVVGALLVAVRIADGWRFSHTAFAFEPRTTPLLVDLRARIEDRVGGRPAADGGDPDG